MNAPAVLRTTRDEEINICKDDIKRILVFYDAKIYYIGDFCLRVGRVRYVKNFFKNTSLQLNFTEKASRKIYESLLDNNPYIDGISRLSPDEIDFEKYDLVLVVMYDENVFWKYLKDRYGPGLEEGRLGVRFFSLSWLFLPEKDTVSYAIPGYGEFNDYMGDRRGKTTELYISPEEKQWANSWLEARGVVPGDRLLIILDATSDRRKMLNVHVHFEVLMYLLDKPDVKILIYDENKLGKEAFYREWLGEERMQKLIFASSNQLREDLCLIGSDYTRMMMGPCTGLMHCAVSIFNNYISKGLSPEKVPAIITYTGDYTKKNANTWWGGVPLIDCLLLEKKNGETRLITLNELSDEQRIFNKGIPCTGYTAEMLINFLKGRLQTIL